MLRTEPRWRQLIHFPGEDSDAIEKKRTKRALQAWRRKMQWVLVGEAADGWRFRCGVLVWNAIVCWYSWWLFGLEYYALLQAILVAIALMAATSALRFVDAKEHWARVPSREQVWNALPPREKVEEWLEIAKEWAIRAWHATTDTGTLAWEELQKCRALGWSPYIQDAKPRLAAWWESVMGRIEKAREEADSLHGEEEQPAGRRKPKGFVDRIAKWWSDATGGGGGGGGSGGEGETWVGISAGSLWTVAHGVREKCLVGSPGNLAEVGCLDRCSSKYKAEATIRHFRNYIVLHYTLLY